MAESTVVETMYSLMSTNVTNGNMMHARCTHDARMMHT